MLDQKLRHIFALSLLILTSACDRALVYGERSGLNIAVRADPAEGYPLEVNTGLQRRVVAFVPPGGHDASGAPKGEAVNMLSQFDVRRTKTDAGPFSSIVTIRSAFASGKAAIAASTNPNAVAAIAGGPSFRLSSDEGLRAVQAKLIQYISQGEAQIDRYLQLAREGNLTISQGGTQATRALGTINASQNTNGNKAIAELLNL